MTNFIVNYAFYLSDTNSLCDCEDLFCSHHIKPSKEIDERTIRIKQFNSIQEAQAYAKSIFEQNKDDDFFAYLEIKKCVTELIEKLK